MKTFFLAVLLVAAAQAQQVTPQSAPAPEARDAKTLSPAPSRQEAGASKTPVTFSIRGNIGQSLAFDNATQTSINLGGQTFSVVFSFDQQNGEASTRGCDGNSRYLESNKSPSHMRVTATCSSVFQATENDGNYSRATVKLGNLTFSSSGVNIKRLYVSRTTPVTPQQTPAALEFTLGDDTLGLLTFRMLLPAEAFMDSDWRSSFSSEVVGKVGSDTHTAAGIAEICTTPGLRGAACAKYIRAELLPTYASSPASNPVASQALSEPPRATQPQAQGTSTCEATQPEVSAASRVGSVLGGIIGRKVPLGRIGQVAGPIGQVVEAVRRKPCQSGQSPLIVRPNSQSAQ